MHALRLRVEGGPDGVTTCGEEALGRDVEALGSVALERLRNAGKDRANTALVVLDRATTGSGRERFVDGRVRLLDAAELFLGDAARELEERATDHLGPPHMVVTHESCAASRAAVPHAGILAHTRCPP
jgi:hypothetical protein